MPESEGVMRNRIIGRTGIPWKRNERYARATFKPQIILRMMIDYGPRGFALIAGLNATELHRRRLPRRRGIVNGVPRSVVAQFNFKKL